MLEGVVKGDRLFTVVNAIPEEFCPTGEATLNETVTLGYMKACQTYADGTSMVLLAGLCRLTVQEYLMDDVITSYSIHYTKLYDRYFIQHIRGAGAQPILVTAMKRP